MSDALKTLLTVVVVVGCLVATKWTFWPLGLLLMFAFAGWAKDDLENDDFLP